MRKAQTNVLPLHQLELANKMGSFNAGTSRVILQNVLKTIKNKKYKTPYYIGALGETFNKLGIIENRQGDYTAALSEQLKALECYKSIIE